MGDSDRRLVTAVTADSPGIAAASARGAAREHPSHVRRALPSHKEVLLEGSTLEPESQGLARQLAPYSGIHARAESAAGVCFEPAFMISSSAPKSGECPKAAADVTVMLGMPCLRLILDPYPPPLLFTKINNN